MQSTMLTVPTMDLDPFSHRPTVPPWIWHPVENACQNVYIYSHLYIYALLDMLWEPDRKGRKDVRLYVRRSGAGPTERHNGGTKDTRAAPKRGRSRREDTRETTGQGEISRLLRVNWKKCLCKVKKLRF